LLPLDLALNTAALKSAALKSGSPGRRGWPYFADMRNVFDRLVYVIGDDLLAAFVRSHVESAIHDADQRSELAAVVLHEKNIFVADLEFQVIDYTHRLAGPLLYIAPCINCEKSPATTIKCRPAQRAKGVPRGLITNDSGGWARTDARQTKQKSKTFYAKTFSSQRPLTCFDQGPQH